MLVPGGNTPKFKTITAGILHVDMGDTVKYYYNGGERVGEVSGVAKGQLKIKRPKDAHDEIDVIAVTQVMEKNASLSAAEKKKLHDYYVQVYPADYVDKLLKNA